NSPDDTHTPRTLANEDCLCLSVMSAPLQFKKGLTRLLNPLQQFFYLVCRQPGRKSLAPAYAGAVFYQRNSAVPPLRLNTGLNPSRPSTLQATRLRLPERQTNSSGWAGLI